MAQARASTLEIVIADAAPEEGYLATLLSDLELPHLATLAAHAREESTPELATDRLTAWQAWLVRGHDRPNWAELWRRAYADGGESNWKRWWLATPVRLEVGLDKVTLHDPADLALSEAHAVALFECARAVLEAHGWHSRALTPTNWLIGRSDEAVLDAATLECAVGADVLPFLPQGDGATERAWRVAHNDVQMNWFSLRANEEREASGLPAVNGLWLAGSGSSARLDLPYATIDSPRPEMRASGSGGGTGARLLLIESLSAPARRADWALWRDALVAIDGRLGQALAQLGAGSIGELRVVLAGRHKLRAVTLARGGRWRFWRRASATALWQGLDESAP